MPDPTNAAARLALLGLLWVLALPILLVRGIAQAFAASRARTVVRRGFLVCPYCGRGNRLDVLVRCRCGFAEFRSLALPCSECGYRPGWIFCSGPDCGASLRLP